MESFALTDRYSQESQKILTIQFPLTSLLVHDWRLLIVLSTTSWFRIWFLLYLFKEKSQDFTWKMCQVSERSGLNPNSQHACTVPYIYCFPLCLSYDMVRAGKAGDSKEKCAESNKNRCFWSYSYTLLLLMDLTKEWKQWSWDPW